MNENSYTLTPPDMELNLQDVSTPMNTTYGLIQWICFLIGLIVIICSILFYAKQKIKINKLSASMNQDEVNKSVKRMNKKLILYIILGFIILFGPSIFMYIFMFL